MGVIRCPKGHYYNSEKYTQCPHCGIYTDVKDETSARKVFAPFSSLFEKKQVNVQKKKNGIVIESSSLIYEEDDDDRTIGISKSEVIVPGTLMEDDDDDHTIGISYSDQVQEYGQSSINQRVRIAASDRIRVTQPEDETVVNVPLFSEVIEKSEKIRTVEEDPKEDINMEDTSDYVMGWLVCVNGPDRGYEIRLHQGMRKVKKVCAIECQGKDEVFLHAEGEEYVYCNGTKVSGTVELHNDDILVIQNYEYVFVKFNKTW